VKDVEGVLQGLFDGKIAALAGGTEEKSHNMPVRLITWPNFETVNPTQIQVRSLTV